MFSLAQWRRVIFNLPELHLGVYCVLVGDICVWNIAVSADVSEFLSCLQKRHEALKHRELQLLKQIEDLQKDCLRNLADRQNEVNALWNSYTHTHTHPFNGPL